MSAEGEPIGYLLARIHSNMDRRANNTLKASGMTFSQMRLLHFLFKQGEATPSQKDIEDFLQVSHPTVVGLIQRLEAKELVRSGFDSQDRRVKSVYLTEAGRGFMSGIRRFCRRNRCGILPVVVGVCHFENDAQRHRVFAVPEAERCTDLAAVDGLLRTAEQLPHQWLGHVDRQPAAGRRVYFGQVFPQAGHAPQGESLLFGEIVVERQPEFGIGRDRRQ